MWMRITVAALVLAVSLTAPAAGAKHPANFVERYGQWEWTWVMVPLWRPTSWNGPVLRSN